MRAEYIRIVYSIGTKGADILLDIIENLEKRYFINLTVIDSEKEESIVRVKVANKSARMYKGNNIKELIAYIELEGVLRDKVYWK